MEIEEGKSEMLGEDGKDERRSDEVKGRGREEKKG